MACASRLAGRFIPCRQPIFLELASRREIDLWTLDDLWWHLASRPAKRFTEEAASAAQSGKVTGIERNLHAAAGPQNLPATSPSFTLPSGLSFSFAEAQSRLTRFCRQEFAYYDGIVDLVPTRVEPIDILATVSMNSRVNDAAKIRSVHRGLAGRCDSLLPRIPVHADLTTRRP